MKLSELTTLKVGGPARNYVEGSTRDELIAVLTEAWASADDWLVIGGGSNMVVGDAGFDGTVIKVGNRGAEHFGGGLIRAQAGEGWDDLAGRAVSAGLNGLEALSGIPGTVGAAPIQNIGAYGQELSRVLVSVDFLDFDSGEIVELTAKELELGYRTSSLKQGRRGAVLSVVLQLSTEPQPVEYEQLADALGVSVGTVMPAAEVRRAVLELRASKGMLLDPNDPDSVSAGSFFTNPIVSENFARRLPPDAPRWLTRPELAAQSVALGQPPAEPASVGPAEVKLSAAWLIERAGIHRGFRIPGSRAGISSKHTLAIVNLGEATAEEIVQLAGFVQTRVLAEFGIALKPEPTFVAIYD